MKTSYLQKFNLFIVFCLFLFSAKTSTAQLVAGDLAIIGVNAETTVNPTPRATISFVALTEIPTGTVIHLTDIGYTGSAFVLAPVPPATTSPDGTANWTVTTKVPAGTVFTVTIQSGVSPTVSILPNTFGSISLDASSWSHAVAAPIPINAGDSWFLYTGTKTSPDFIYGFTNSKNPDLDEIDESTGWTKDTKTPKNQSSILPAALKTANAYTSLISFKTVDQQRDFNAYSGTFSGSKSTLLAQIKNTASWTATDNTTDAKVLIPGTTGGAFPGPQPIYKLGSSVLSVISNPTTGQFRIGETVAILVKFSDLVNVVSGTPRLKLNSAPNTYVNYASGTGTNTLTFNYTVAAGETSPDLNYTSTTALELNGAVLTDALGDNALLQLPALDAAESLAGSSNVLIDGVPPTLPFVSIVANNASYPAYAKAGAVVTLSFRASESITTPIVTIGGATVTASPAGGFNWVALYVLPSGLAEGVVPFTINYTDTYGNTGAQQTTVSTGSMVTLDKTTPTLSNVSISSNNPNPALAKPGDQVSLTFTGSEGLGTPLVSFYGSPAASVVSAANNVWTATANLTLVNAEGAVPFQISYSDFAGNAGTAVTTTNDASTVIYDKTLPVAPNFLGVTAGDTQN
ncbi:hypothetical protein OQX61_24130, partial [Pedobacter sp. PLR]|uniref:hypothetical protein n=1 Tax=Pedobacter sp. PLR TaxID=2994465 RepID=UPI002245A11D